MSAPGEPLNDQNLYIYFLGKVDDSTEAQIKLLQGASLLQALPNGVPVTKEILLQAIARLDAARGDRLGRHASAKWLTAKDPHAQDVYKFNKRAFCEDPRLCLAAVGQRYRAFEVPSLS